MTPIRILLLTAVTSCAAVSTPLAGPVIDQWTAEATQSREGRTYRTLLTFTHDGKVQNGRALWQLDVRCGVSGLGSREAPTVSGSGTAMLAQGGWGGHAPPVGDVYVVEAENDLATGKGELRVGNPGCASGIPIVRHRPEGQATASPKTDPTGRPWTHNGSLVMIDPATGIVAYLKPKASLRPGVETGSVLFRGTLQPGGAAYGTAYAFKDGCPPAPYAVRGRYSEHDYKLTLRGPGPVRRGCEVVGYSDRSPHAVLAFSYLLDD